MALTAAGVPPEKHADLIAMGQSLRDMELKKKMSLIFILFNVNPQEYLSKYEDRLAEKDAVIAGLRKEIAESKKHAVQPLPKELQDFTTISELQTLCDVKSASKQALQHWEETNFQNEEHRLHFTSIISDLEEGVAQAVAEMRDNIALRPTLLKVIASAYDSFYPVYGALWKNVTMCEGVALKRYELMSEDFRISIAASKDAGHLPIQRSDGLMDLYLDYAATHQKFDELMKEVVKKIPGAQWKKGPAKQAFRMIEKKYLRPNARGFAKVCDSGRGMVEAETMNDVCEVRQEILDLAATDPYVWIVRIKERYLCPSSGGWRDDLINIKVMLPNGVYLVFEVQISQGKMLTARKTLDGHAIFNKSRNASEMLILLFGDTAPSLALIVVKAGDAMISWAEERGWFLEKDIREWVGVIASDDGKFEGFDITGMDGSLASNFLPAIQHGDCSLMVKRLVNRFDPLTNTNRKPIEQGGNLILQ